MKAKLRTMLLSCLALLLVLGMTSVACAYDVSFSDVPGFRSDKPKAFMTAKESLVKAAE